VGKAGGRQGTGKGREKVCKQAWKAGSRQGRQEVLLNIGLPDTGKTRKVEQAGKARSRQGTNTEGSRLGTDREGREGRESRKQAGKCKKGRKHACSLLPLSTGPVSLPVCCFVPFLFSSYGCHKKATVVLYVLDDSAST